MGSDIGLGMCISIYDISSRGLVLSATCGLQYHIFYILYTLASFMKTDLAPLLRGGNTSQPCDILSKVKTSLHPYSQSKAPWSFAILYDVPYIHYPSQVRIIRMPRIECSFAPLSHVMPSDNPKNSIPSSKQIILPNPNLVPCNNVFVSPSGSHVVVENSLKLLQYSHPLYIFRNYNKHLGLIVLLIPNLLSHLYKV